MRQILVNLLGNAVQFTPQGGRISISRQLARDMAGDLRVTSAIGEGSTFILSLAPVQES